MKSDGEMSIWENSGIFNVQRNSYFCDLQFYAPICRVVSESELLKSYPLIEFN